MHQLIMNIILVEDIGYDGGTPYSGGNGYSSGAGYSSTSVASSGGYSLYVPQSAYYSKEAQLVAEEGEKQKKPMREVSI